MRRTWTTVVATAVLLAAGAAQPSTAGQVATAAVVAGESHAREDPPLRHLHGRVVTIHGRLVFKGRVDPGHGPVIVQKKSCSKKTCPWRRFARVTTHGPQERWQVRVYAPRHGNWYWRGYVRAYGGYRRSWTHVWKTYVTRD